MQTSMTIIAQGTHPVNRKNYSSTEANISLCQRSPPHPLPAQLSRWIKRSSLLECRGLTNRHIAPSMQLVQFTLTGDPRIFVESHATGSRASMEAANEFVRPMSTRGCELHTCARHLFEWRSGCLMNREARFIDRATESTFFPFSSF